MDGLGWRRSLVSGDEVFVGACSWNFSMEYSYFFFLIESGSIYCFINEYEMFLFRFRLSQP